MDNIYLLESKWNDKVSFWWTQAFKIWTYSHGQVGDYGRMFLIVYLAILGYSSVRKNWQEKIFSLKTA